MTPRTFREDSDPAAGEVQLHRPGGLGRKESRAGIAPALDHLWPRVPELVEVARRGDHVARVGGGDEFRTGRAGAAVVVRVHHVGALPKLEDQLVQWDPIRDSWSPDRLDALVWALTDLLVLNRPRKSIFDAV